MISEQFILAVFVLIVGLLVGSFLNVCVYRIPLGKTVVKGRSYCPDCGALIHWYQNIPLISYLALAGRCATCKTRISPIYPAVEVLTGFAFVLVWMQVGPTPEFLFLVFLTSILIVISGIDLAHRIIPDGLVLFLLGLGVVHLIYQIWILDTSWYPYVIGFFAASVPLLLLGFIYPDGMGGGDIKLMAAAGLFLGFKLVLFSLFLGAIFAGVYSLVLLLTKRGSMKSEIPFGPYLSAGIFTVALWGEELYRWYWSFFS